MWPFSAMADVKRERAKLAVRRREQDALDMQTVGGMFDRMHEGGDGSREVNDVDGCAVAGAGAGAGPRAGRDEVWRAIAVAGELAASPAASTAVVKEAGGGAEGTSFEEHTNAAADCGGGGDKGEGTASRAEQRGAIPKRGGRGKARGGLYDAADAALPGSKP